MLAGLSRLRPPKATRLGVSLDSVAGFTGGGEIRYTERPGQRRRIEADLTGVAGLKVEVVVHSSPVGALSCREGAVTGRLETDKGAPIPALAAGDLVEIRQNGVAILRGRLQRA
jgi:hypothetical protein